MAEETGKFKLFVAFNREASDYLEEHGIAATIKRAEKAENEGEDTWAIETLTFNTAEERDCYLRGMGDANGWESPSSQSFEGNEDEIIPTPSIEDVEDFGDEMENYPVDESMTNANAGDAIKYEYNGRIYEIIQWNNRAVDHEQGSKQIADITPEDKDKV